MPVRLKVHLLEMPHYPYLIFAADTTSEEIDLVILEKYGVCHPWVSEILEVDDRIPKLKSQVAQLKLNLENETRENRAFKREIRHLKIKLIIALAKRYKLEEEVFDLDGARENREIKPSEKNFEIARNNVDPKVSWRGHLIEK